MYCIRLRFRSPNLVVARYGAECPLLLALLMFVSGSRTVFASEARDNLHESQDISSQPDAGIVRGCLRLVDVKLSEVARKTQLKTSAHA